ncbi:Hsp20/alpha crystallin family protein [Massilia sp. PAMC28688]|uniref:Hsp20/alpha crystallin family protein n=1 Tax=Massilia sp. PAMC28688 TaxID=2861283 RepID=UPI001C63A91A|nr:Hsp20/alpha crystallin family protein [Massilia sp. PAMC28688]QYF92985.1 Hsp20/alpha crystallin family protein [Massilia sp. PAMC28688]
MAGSLQRFDPQGNVSHFDPMRGLGSMFDLFDFMRPGRMSGMDQLRIDVNETDEAYLVKAEMPGFKKEDIKVAINGDQVSISGERSTDQERKEGNVVCRERYQGSQYRSFTLPQLVDEEKASATCTDGVLELTLPKKAGSGARQLPVQ